VEPHRRAITTSMTPLRQLQPADVLILEGVYQAAGAKPAAGAGLRATRSLHMLSKAVALHF
jgi:hypothetical protein